MHQLAASPPRPGRRVPGGRRLPRQPGAPPHVDPRAKSLKAVYRDVEWSISFIGFMAYVVSIITYLLPIGDVAMAAAIGGLIFEKKRIRLGGPVAIFGAFLVWSFVGVSGSEYPASANAGWVNFARLWLIAFVAVNVLNSRARVRFFLIFFLGLFALFPARGTMFNWLVYSAAELGRVAWVKSFGNPNDMAAQVFLPLGIAVGLLADPHPLIKKGALASVVVLPLVIMATGSRAALIALGAFALVGLATTKRRMRNFGLLALLGIGLTIVSPSTTWDRIQSLIAIAEAGGDLTVADDDKSAEQRFMIWEVAGDLFREHPVAGTGITTYPSAHAHHVFFNREKYLLARGPRDAHSTYFTIAVETGLIGLLLFLGIIASTLMAGRKARRRGKNVDPELVWQMRFVALGLWGYMVAAVFGTFGHLALFYLHIAILSAMTAALLSEVVAARRRSAPVRRWTATRRMPAPAAVSGS